MVKIATHDSGTGEKSKNFLSKLGEVFAKTQDKTIKEQWNAGVRYFDLRVDNKLTICHGLWEANKNLYDILSLLNKLAATDKQNKTYYQVTIEKNYKDWEIIANKLDVIRSAYPNVICTKVNKKYPTWTCVYDYIDVSYISDYVSVPTPKQYCKLSIKDWKRYIPIPRTLHKNYKRKHKFNDNYFVMVDFY